MLRPILFWFGVALALVPVYADKIRFEHYTIEEGLSQSAVMGMLQDKLGFIWLCTQDGLNRFDGHQFRVFRPDDADPNSIPENYIYCMSLDEENNLWLGTYSSGLVRYDPRTECFKNFTNDPTNPKSLNDNRVLSLLSSKDGSIWVGTIRGLSRFDPKTEHFENIASGTGAKAIGGLEIKTLLEDLAGNLWVGTTDGGLFRRNRETGLVTPFRHKAEDAHSLNSNEIHALLESPDGRIWVGTSKGLELLDPKNGVVEHWSEQADPSMRIPAQNITALYRLSSQEIWVGSFDHGIYRLDLEKGQRNLVNQANDPTSLSHNSIFSFLESRDGVVWVGTYGAGVCKFDPRTLAFEHLNSERDDEKGLTSNMIRAVMEDRKGRLWVGTMETGLDLFDANHFRIANFRAHPNEPNSLRHDNIFAIQEDPDGRIWIATLAGLSRLDPESKQFEHFSHNPRDSSTLSSPSPRTFYLDDQNQLWVGTEAGLNLYDRVNKCFRRYLHDPADPSSISNDRIRPILKDRKSRFWVGTGEGFNLFDPETGRCKRFYHDKSNPASLSNNRIMAITETPDGKLLLGTLGGGINLFDPDSESVERFGVREGLPNDVIYSILVDNQGLYWITTNNGLSRFNLKTRQFKNFYASDGLQSNEYNLGAAFAGNSGNIYVGGINGLSCFRPDQIYDNPNLPPVYLTNFYLFNQPQTVTSHDPKSRLTAALPYLNEIHLYDSDRVFAFEFSALDYTNPKKTKFAYKLEGFDRDWLETDAKKRFAAYTSLKAGRYFFKVKGCNNDGVWSRQELRLEVCIHPPFWWTPLAQVVYGVFVLALIWAFIRWRTGKIRERARILLLEESEKMAVEANRAKSVFLSSMSHELRTPLSAIIGYTEMMLEDIHQLCYEDLSDNLHHIHSAASHQLTLINNILDHSKIVAGRMELFPETIRVRSLLEDVRGTVLPLITRNGNRFELLLETEHETLVADQVKLKQCLINLLGNAGKFTKNGLVQLRAYNKREDELEWSCFEVKDTGTGIAEEMQGKLFQEFFQASLASKKKGEGTGLGLAISRNFVQLMGGDIQLWSKLGEGSCFTIRIPRHGMQHTS